MPRTRRASAPSNSDDQRRDEILDAALEAFARHGFVGTSTDVLAADAAVSKQTLYKMFGDKNGVFAALIHRACARVVDPFAVLLPEMETSPSAEHAMRLLADQFVGSITNPSVQKLRRLVIAEAPRFPDLGELYWAQGFQQTLASLADCFVVLHRRGLLRVDNPQQAAQHFAGLLLWIPSNQIMFAPTSPLPAADDLEPIIDDGVRVFVRAYGTD